MNRILKAATHPRRVCSVVLKRMHPASVMNGIHSCRESLWVRKDSKHISRAGKVLFLDVGSNVGQGYSWFSRYYKQKNVTFELFEPNPNCFNELLKLPAVKSGGVKAHNCGVGVQSGAFKFYGLSNDEGGALSQGGSFVKEHNSDFYEASQSAAMDIEVIDFAEFLTEKSQEFDKVIVKMDIEGAEVDLLESMIGNKSIALIDILYVEFHSQYMKKDQSEKVRRRESSILKSLKGTPELKVRLWH